MLILLSVLLGHAHSPVVVGASLYMTFQLVAAQVCWSWHRSKDSDWLLVPVPVALQTVTADGELG